MSSPLPNWLERVLGIETAPGEGVVWRLQYAWGWPSWVTLVFAVVAVALVVGCYLRENPQASRRLRLGLAGVRLLLIAVVVFMLAQSSLSLDRTGLPLVAVIVDDSESMSIADGDLRPSTLNPQPSTLNSQPIPPDAAGGLGSSIARRWDMAQKLLTERDGALLSRIRRQHKLRVYFLTGLREAVADDVAGLVDEIDAAKPVGASTRLGAAVDDVLDAFRGSPPAAIVLVTDGVNTDGPSLEDAAATARRRGVPLLIVGLGDDRPVRDLKLSDLLVDDVVFVGDMVLFDAKLTGNGFAGRKVNVRLRREDDARVLAETEVTVAADGQPQTVRTAYRPGEEGRFHYVVEVEPLDGENQTANNRLERTIEVRDQRIRVLLVEAYPSFEFRYLSNTLTRDEGVELDTVLQEADPEHVEDDATALAGFPVSRDELFAYDVVIFGDVNPDLLSTAMMENLAAFVDQSGKGGSLVMIAGPRYMPLAYRDTPLARLLPFRLDTVRYPDPGQTLYDGFTVAPNELGLTSPATQLGDTPLETAEIWAHLPPLYWLLEVTEPKPGARVLAVASDRFTSDGRALPVVLVQYVGTGKVLFHATDETWRWRWRVGDVYFARYWVQMIRYLSRSILAGGDGSAVLSSDRREYRYGDTVRLRLRFEDARFAPAEDDGATVVVEHEGHQTRRIQLHRDTAARGVFEGVLSKPSVGNYHAWLAVPPIEGRTPAVDFTVAAPPGELQRVAMDAASLRRVAKTTGGTFYTYENAGRLLSDLPKGRQVPIEPLPAIPLWNAWPVLLLVLMLLTTEWLLRKRAGMA